MVLLIGIFSLRCPEFDFLVPFSFESSSFSLLLSSEICFDDISIWLHILILLISFQ